jgi:hypothetical protein
VNTLLILLAVAGGLSAAWHLVRAASRFVTGEAMGVVAAELEHTHARHGDLTALEERRRERRVARRRGRWAGLAALGWLVLLVAPSFTPWPRMIFAGYSVLWLGPATRSLRGGRS